MFPLLSTPPLWAVFLTLCGAISGVTGQVSGPEADHVTPFPPPHITTSPNDVTREDTWPPPETPRDPSSSEREYNVITHGDHLPRQTSGFGGVLKMADVSTLSPDGVLASSTPSSDASTGEAVTSDRQRAPDIDPVSSSTNSRPEMQTYLSPAEKQPSENPVRMPWLATSRLPSDEERLLSQLFSNYNPSARPVMNSSKTVPVAIQFSLMHIKDLDVRSQIFTTTGLLILEWTDERLTWVPEEHNNMTEIIIEAKGLWRPEFAVINGAEKIYEDYNQFRAVIVNNGVIHWEPGGVFKTMCEIDITYYPFDEQICELTFGAWSYHTSKMNLTNSSATVNLDSYKKNGEWEIYATEVKRNEFFYECCPNERFANVAFNIYLRRRHTFYIMNVILPSIMTSVLLLSIFFCTPGQKVQIGVVVLLSFRIFLLNVAGNIPKTSDHIPLLGIYLTCTMAITTLSMVLTVFVLNLHHITDRPVPGWAKKLVFIYLARMMGMCGSASEASARSRRRQPRSNSTNFFRRSSVVVDAEGDERTAIIELHHRGAGTGGAPPGVGVNGAGAGGGGGNETPAPHPNAFENNYSFSKTPREREEDKEKPEDYGKDWRRMAEIFDRLFFWLFLLAILISTLVLFHPLTNSYMVNSPTVQKR